jgi:hypothetical protein
MNYEMDSLTSDFGIGDLLVLSNEEDKINVGVCLNQYIYVKNFYIYRSQTRAYYSEVYYDVL